VFIVINPESKKN